MADHVTFIDNDITAANRITAAWLNGVNNNSYRANALIPGYSGYRTNQERAMDRVSAADLGVVGDGTDEYTKIQAAILACEGKELWFPTPAVKYCYGTALTTVGLTSIKITGEAGIRACVFEYTGAGAAPGFTADAALDNFQIENICFNNSGAGTIGLQINCVRSVVTRCSSVSAVLWSSAVMSTYQAAGYGYFNVFRDCYFAVTDSSQTTPIGLLLGGGHTVVVDACMFNGFTTGIKQQTGGGTTLYGLSVVNSRIEAFSGDSSGYPGGHAAIGLDVGDCMGLNVSGCNFEMDGDGQVSAAAQRAIKLGTVAGGSIAGNHFAGNGQCTASINISSSAAKNVVIQGNNFRSINGYGIEATGTGQLYNVNIDANNAAAPTTGVFNNSFTPTLSFNGSSTGITYSAQVGRWQRNGLFVTASFSIQLTSKGAQAGAARVSGLPLGASATSGTDTSAASTLLNTTGLGATQVCAYLPLNSAQMRFYRMDTGAEIVDTALTNTSYIQANVTYPIDNP